MPTPFARSYKGRLCADCSHFGRIYVDESTVLAAILEADNAADLGEESVILAATYVCAGLERGSALAHDDAAAEDGLAAEHLDPEPLGI